VVPQDDLGAPPSPSCTRSPDPKVVGEALLMTHGQLLRREEQLKVGRLHRRWRIQRWRAPLTLLKRGKDIPKNYDVDPISARPAGAEDLIRDQPQIDQAPRGPGTSGAQVPESSSSSPRLPRREINWNGTPC
jgi:hypothetical protein